MLIKSKLLLSLIACTAVLMPRTRGESTIPELGRIQLFALGGIGEGGATSPGELALTDILKSPHCIAQLKSLFPNGSPEAKCYALAALHVISKSNYLELAEMFSKEHFSHIHTMSGCIGLDRAGDQVLADISSGNYDFRINKDMRNNQSQPSPGG